MKVTKTKHVGNRVGYQVELGTYDATPPTASIIFDTLPLEIDPNREAVALYLLLNSWCGGEFILPRWVSPHVMGELSQDFGPTHLHFDKVEYYPKAIPKGQSRYLLTDVPHLVAENNTIVSLRSDRFSGNVRGLNSVAVSNNLFMFKREMDDPFPAVALGVLFAEALGIDTLVLPDSTDAFSLERLSRLLGSVNLDIDTSSRS